VTGLAGADRAALRYLAQRAGWFVLHTFHRHDGLVASMPVDQGRFAVWAASLSMD
jgi:hypothetical protein